MSPRLPTPLLASLASLALLLAAGCAPHLQGATSAEGVPPGASSTPESLIPTPTERSVPTLPDGPRIIREGSRYDPEFKITDIRKEGFEPQCIGPSKHNCVMTRPTRCDITPFAQSFAIVEIATMSPFGDCPRVEGNPATTMELRVLDVVAGADLPPTLEAKAYKGALYYNMREGDGGLTLQAGDHALVAIRQSDARWWAPQLVKIIRPDEPGYAKAPPSNFITLPNDIDALSEHLQETITSLHEVCPDVRWVDDPSFAEWLQGGRCDTSEPPSQPEREDDLMTHPCLLNSRVHPCCTNDDIPCPEEFNRR